MLRKIMIWILCLSIIMPTTLEVKAVEYEKKTLSIRRLNDGTEATYEVVTDGKNVYIGVDDLIQVVEFDEKVIDITDETINQIVLTKEVDHHGYDQDINIFPKKKKIKSAWYGTDKFEGCLNIEEGIYLDIVEIFNYLRVKAEIVGDELLINIPVYSTLDFMIYDYQSVLINSVSQLDLLEAQESSFSSGFLDALSLACNNFDFRLLIPVWGASELKDEQYAKAIQILNQDDEMFYNENTSEYMKNELSVRGFDGVLATGADLVHVMSIGGQTIETAEEVVSSLEDISTEEMNSYMELINWNGENYDSFMEMRAWNKYAGNISDAISLANIAVSAYETYTRAKSWNQECLEDLEVLKNLEVDNYGDYKGYVKRIKKVAEECYEESANEDEAVVEQTLEDVSTLLLEKVITESSIYGQVADYFILAVNTGISVARCFGNIASEMDKAELSYIVTCLINIAAASRIDAEVEYDMLNLEDMNSGEVQEFRNSMRTAIKSNLRCWSYIYYLNSDGSWENTYRGKEVQNKIDKMHTYLTLLDESAQYDYALDEYDLITYSSKRIINILNEGSETSPNVSDNAYELYMGAVEKTTESGSWTEDLTMTTNMVITKGSARSKTKVTLNSNMDISNYFNDDLSKLHMSGSARMSVMGQSYAWNMLYENGVAHYQYTEPNKTSADMEMDPSCFQFNTLTDDMLSDSKISGNQIRFTVSGDEMAEAGIAAVNLMTSVDNLEYGDVKVIVTMNTEGGIDTVTMKFHASLTYQGFDAEADYEIVYNFSVE